MCCRVMHGILAHPKLLFILAFSHSLHSSWQYTHQYQVDAKHVELHLDEQKPEGVVNEALEQVAYADRIILNKTDLVSPEDLARVHGRLKAINGMATILEASRAQVPVEYVLGVGGFDLDRIDAEVRADGG